MESPALIASSMVASRSNFLDIAPEKHFRREPQSTAWGTDVNGEYGASGTPSPKMLWLMQLYLQLKEEGSNGLFFRGSVTGSVTAEATSDKVVSSAVVIALSADLNHHVIPQGSLKIQGGLTGGFQVHVNASFPDKSVVSPLYGFTGSLTVSRFPGVVTAAEIDCSLC